MAQKKFASMKTLTPKFRVSFPAVFEPKADLQGKLKYSLDMLFDKDTTDFKKMKAAVAYCIKETWGEKPEGFKSPFKDGAKPNRKGIVLNGYENARVLTAKSNDQPGIVDQQKNEIIAKKDFYGGCYAHATIIFKAYEVLGQVGVTCYLQNIQKLEDGESFGGRSNPDDDFEVIGGDFDVDDATVAPQDDEDDF